jgi:hypothetical protein
VGWSSDNDCSGRNDACVEDDLAIKLMGDDSEAGNPKRGRCGRNTTVLSFHANHSVCVLTLDTVSASLDP